MLWTFYFGGVFLPGPQNCIMYVLDGEGGWFMFLYISYKTLHYQNTFEDKQTHYIVANCCLVMLIIYNRIITALHTSVCILSVSMNARYINHWMPNFRQNISVRNTRKDTILLYSSNNLFTSADSSSFWSYETEVQQVVTLTYAQHWGRHHR